MPSSNSQADMEDRSGELKKRSIKLHIAINNLKRVIALGVDNITTETVQTGAECLLTVMTKVAKNVLSCKFRPSILIVNRMLTRYDLLIAKTPEDQKITNQVSENSKRFALKIKRTKNKDVTIIGKEEVGLRWHDSKLEEINDFVYVERVDRSRSMDIESCR